MTPVKLAPRMLITVSSEPDGRLNPVMRGTSVKFVALCTEAAGLVTEMRPVRAPAGTVTRIDVAESTVIGAVTLTLPKVTAVTVPRLVPFRVTSVPTCPDAGVKGRDRGRADHRC